MGLAYIMISHDLGVVEHVSDRVAVMYLGRIFEQGGWQEIFENPRHPYTRALIAAIPDPFHRAAVDARAKAKGEIPSALNPPSGCAFQYALPRSRSTSACNRRLCSKPSRRVTSRHAISARAPI